VVAENPQLILYFAASAERTSGRASTKVDGQECGHRFIVSVTRQGYRYCDEANDDRKKGASA
jgi:hypothetical protein